MSHLDHPFVIHTFIETRGLEPYRVFHPMGASDGWDAKRNIYNDRRLAGAGPLLLHEPPVPPDTVPFRFDCQHDTFLVLAGKDALLHHNTVKPTACWWECEAAGVRPTWLLIHPDDILFQNFDHIPDDHLEYQTFTRRHPINDRSGSEVLDALWDELGLPPFLTSYRADDKHHEAIVMVPTARTVHYNRLREQHLSD